MSEPTNVGTTWTISAGELPSCIGRHHAPTCAHVLQRGGSSLSAQGLAFTYHSSQPKALPNDVGRPL